MEDASAQPGPYHQDVIATPHCVPQHRVERGTLFATFGAADAVVLVGLLHRPTAMLRDTLQDEPLVFSGLIVTAHAQVDRSADGIGVHGLNCQDMKL